MRKFLFILFFVFSIQGYLGINKGYFQSVVYGVQNQVENEVKELEVSFFLNVDKNKSYWVGDILSFYSKDNELLGVLSKYSGAQNLMLANPDTISFDIVDKLYLDKAIKKSDFIDLGKPGQNSAYLGFMNGQLYAISFGDVFCKSSPEADWRECGYLKDRSHFSSEVYSKHIESFMSKDEYVTPIFIGLGRILLAWQKSGLSDCSISDDDKWFCVKTISQTLCPYFYTYNVVGDIASLYCANGDKYLYNLQSQMVTHATQANRLKLSNQFYTSIIIRDEIYLGHYPSGGLLRKSEFGEEFVTSPPFKKINKPSQRELQTLAYIGGKIIAGIWPWGEIWEASLDEKNINFYNSVNLFKQDPYLQDAEHPNENVLPKPYDYNELGQRVASIVPCWDGVCISTSSKGSKIDSIPGVQDNVLSEYGRVYYLHGPKSNCSTDLIGNNYLKLTINKNGSAKLFKGDQILCNFNFEQKYMKRIINKTDKISIGSQIGYMNGHHGQIVSFLRR